MSLLNLILSYFYGLAVYARNWLYDVGILRQTKLEGFVISVGNIAVGGTGKSPVVVELIKFIQTLGDRFHIVILTRGYKSGLKSGEWLCLRGGKVIDGSSVFAKSCKPDEALMQSLMCPEVDVLVGNRRLENSKLWQATLQKEPPTSKNTVWILDDGFQHRKIDRDLEVLLLDAEKPFGELLPRGMFREAAGALCRSDEIVFTRAKSGQPKPGDRALVELHRRDSKVSETVFETLRPRSAIENSSEVLLDGQEVCVVSGLARNGQFVESIKSQGFKVQKVVEFDDHAPIDRGKILEALGDNSSIPVVTTAKDFSRSRGVFSSLPCKVYVAELKIQLALEVKERLKASLAAKFDL